MTNADRSALDALFSGMGPVQPVPAAAGRLRMPVWSPWLLVALAAALGYLGGRFHEACLHVKGG